MAELVVDVVDPSLVRILAEVLVVDDAPFHPTRGDSAAVPSKNEKAIASSKHNSIRYLAMVTAW